MTNEERAREWWTKLRLGVSPHDEPVIRSLAAEFAAVRKEERERCARVAEGLAGKCRERHDRLYPKGTGNPHLRGYEDGCKDTAAAIRKGEGA